MGKRHKKSEAKRLEFPQEMINKYHAAISEYLESYFDDMTAAKASAKADEILKKVIAGWPRAAPNIEGRIKTWFSRYYDEELWSRTIGKVGVYSSEYTPTFVKTINKDKIQEFIENKDVTPDIERLLQALQSEEELDFFMRRFRAYHSEWQLNDSSDIPILLRVISEELNLIRLSERQLRNPTASFSKEISESQKRLKEGQTILAVTREQREADARMVDGNVASLTKGLAKKILKWTKIQKEWAEEEANLMEEKQLRGVINPINDEEMAAVREIVLSELRQGGIIDDGRQKDIEKAKA